jgi:hypothetical protein
MGKPYLVIMGVEYYVFYVKSYRNAFSVTAVILKSIFFDGVSSVKLSDDDRIRQGKGC